MMDIPTFERALWAAIQRYFPNGNVIITMARNITLNCRVEIEADTLLAVYFNALTGKTSYALIWRARRIAGYDNYQFWHAHPLENEHEHRPCPAQTPETALASLRNAWETFKTTRKTA